MTRALITGITGQDGVLLAQNLLERGYEVIGFGRRPSVLARTDLHPLFRRIGMFFGDAANSVDLADALLHHQPDELYNLAAQSAPGASWAQSLETGEITAMGAHRLFEAVRRFAPKCRVYHASSSEMFGEVLESPQTEKTPFNPANPYAAAKVYAHQIAHVYRRSYGLFIACGILFNHESPLRRMNFLTQKVAHGAACAKLGIGDSPVLNEEGEPVVRAHKLALGNLDAARDWGHARDYVESMRRMLGHERPDDFVVGTGVLRTVRDLCHAAYGYVGKDWREFVTTDPRFLRPNETGATVADASKARRELNWTPTIGFDAMLAEMVDAQVAALQAARPLVQAVR
jgi:GDPmannose 4,6-dehydratase